MAAPTEEPLRPLPLPAWFYPLCWHQAFPESKRVALLRKTCARPCACANSRPAADARPGAAVSAQSRNRA